MINEKNIARGTVHTKSNALLTKVRSQRVLLAAAVVLKGNRCDGIELHHGRNQSSYLLRNKKNCCFCFVADYGSLVLFVP